MDKDKLQRRMAMIILVIVGIIGLIAYFDDKKRNEADDPASFNNKVGVRSSVERMVLREEIKDWRQGNDEIPLEAFYAAKNWDYLPKPIAVDKKIQDLGLWNKYQSLPERAK